MNRNPKEIVEFSFVLRNHYFKFEYDLDIDPIEKTHEVQNTTTLKLFKSWFKLACNRHYPLYGVVKFKDGETWLWQRPQYVPKIKKTLGGWKLARKSDAEKLKDKQAKQTALWEDFILTTAGFKN